MHKMHPRSLQGLLAGASVLAVVAAAMFWVGRSLGDGGESTLASGQVADPSPVGASPGPANSDIDTSEPGWQDDIIEEWEQKPRSELVINGIHVGPNSDRPLACPSGDIERIAPEVAQQSDLAITATYLPAGTELTPNGQGQDLAARSCDGEVEFYYESGSVPAAPDAEERIAAGEDWFSVPRGGRINIDRWRYPPGAEPGLGVSIPDDHWEEMTINGLPAAAGHPVLDEGLGTGVIIIWDPTTRIQTTIVTYNLAFQELVQIAEGIE